MPLENAQSLDKSSDELEVVVPRLKTSTQYTLEVAAQASNGATGMPRSVQITTPDYPGPPLHSVRAQLR